MLPSIILNVIFFIVAWMFRSKWFKIKVHIDISNSNTSSILIKAIMSPQNNMAKESSSLQNHIVRLCFIFVTQNNPLMHNPDDKPSNWFILFNALQTFQLLRNTWVQAMDIALWWYIVVVVRTKRGEDSLTSTRRINGLWRCPSIYIYY